MSEPVTVITDYVLAAICLVLGSKLVRDARFWALAFLALGAAALLGGTWHGFWQSDALWKATILSVGVASFGMVVGSARATTGGLPRRLLVGVATVKLAAYAAWMIFHDDFIWVVLDTGIALLLVGLMHLRMANGWMLAGVAASALAGLVQASGVALHAHFNHNDLYHVIQAGAMLLLYRGVKRYATGPRRSSTRL
jgi:hypothetical protein